MEPVARTITERVEAGVDTAPRLGLDAICAALGLDPFAGSLQIVDARQALALEAAADGEALQTRWVGPSIRLLDAQVPLIVALRAGPTDSSLRPRMVDWLATRYPATHPVALVGRGTDGPETMALSLGEVASLPDDARYDALYLPPLDPLDDLRAPNTLGYITARLRAPGGCPWDREQTPASLTPYMLEEAHEAVDAIERGDAVDTVEELGDVLLQVVLHSQLAEEEGRFTLADIAAEVNAKLVRRHPHVFGDAAAREAGAAPGAWEAAKARERAALLADQAPATDPPEATGLTADAGVVLADVPLALPALSRAARITRRVAAVGFDWPDVPAVLDKLAEETAELRAELADADPARLADEMGDMLFVMANLARKLGLDAETCLRQANDKFNRRFRGVERLLAQDGRTPAESSLEEMEAAWQQVKRNEAGGQ